MTRQILVGGVPVGGGAPITIQSMTNTRTDDVTATVDQIHRLEEAGCQIIRVAVPDLDAAKAVGAIKARIHIPLVVDIHFDYKLALACVEEGCDAVRINPGNIGGEDRVQAVAETCKARNLPLWTPAKPGRHDVMIFDRKVGMVTDHDKELMEALPTVNGFGFKLGNRGGDGKPRLGGGPRQST